MLFHLVIIDRDKRVFNLVGPMTDDTNWNSKVVKCQEDGRQVTCRSWKGHSLTDSEMITEVANRFDLIYTKEDILQ